MDLSGSGKWWYVVYIITPEMVAKVSWHKLLIADIRQLACCTLPTTFYQNKQNPVTTLYNSNGNMVLVDILHFEVALTLVGFLFIPASCTTCQGIHSVTFHATGSRPDCSSWWHWHRTVPSTFAKVEDIWKIGTWSSGRNKQTLVECCWKSFFFFFSKHGIPHFEGSGVQGNFRTSIVLEERHDIMYKKYQKTCTSWYSWYFR